MSDNGSDKNIVSGLAWTYAERILAQTITGIVTIVLSRIIDPDEFGSITLVTVFITLANVLVSDGFGTALIQKKDSSEIDFNTMLVFSSVASVIIYFILYICAPLIGGYYGIPTLIPVVRVMGLRIPLAALNSIQHAYVSKKMIFKKFFFSTLIGTLVSAVVGIVMALSGFGVWALVAQYLSNCLLDTIILWITIDYKPRIEFSFKRFKPMFDYSWKIVLVGLMISLYTNIRNLIIGKKFTIEDLAYSNKGQQFPELIAVNINTSLGKVLFPAMASNQADIGKIKQMSRRSVSSGTFLLAPLLCGLMAVSASFVRVVLTDKWMPCVPFLRIMCIVYLLQPIQTAALQSIKAIGKSQVYLKLEIIKKALGIIILLVALLYYRTVFAVVFSALIAEVVSTVVNFPAMKKELNYTYFEQVTDVLRPLCKTLIAVLPAYAIELLGLSSVLCLLLQITVGVLLFIFVCEITRDEDYMYIKNKVRIYIPGRKGVC